jgi:hypothetical protein
VAYRRSLVLFFKKPVHQTPGNIPSAMQRLYTVSIDSAEVSHAALIILFDTLSSPEALFVTPSLYLRIRQEMAGST